MSVVSKLLFLVSIIQIFHAGFSSFEYNKLIKDRSIPDQTRQIPRDIKYECYSGLVFFIIATILSFDKLKYYPIRRDSGKKIELLSQDQYLKEISLNKASNVDNLIGNDPTGEVSFTPNLVDIHSKRKEITDWLNSKNS